jgi:hypothetical protein
LGDVGQIVLERLEGRPLDERVGGGRFGARFEFGVDALADLTLGLALKLGEPIDFQLGSTLVGLGSAGHTDSVVEIDFGISPDASSLESRSGNDTGAVANREDRRSGGLFDLYDVTFEGDCLADPARECLDVDIVAGSDGGSIDAVGINIDVFEADVTVLADLDQFDDQFVADAVFAVEVRFVDESGDVLGEIDEDAVLDDPVDGRQI